MSCGWVIQAGTDHAETTVFADEEGLPDASVTFPTCSAVPRHVALAVANQQVAC